MANTKTEYQAEYCGLVCTPQMPRPRQVQLCKDGASETHVVGGPMQESKLNIDSKRLPVCDEDFVAQVYGSEDRASHRVEHRWKDPRWSDPVRCGICALYEPAERDPPNRGNWYLYRSTIVDPLRTPCQPLTVPDVHKLRYLHNNYMSQDDWY